MYNNYPRFSPIAVHEDELTILHFQATDDNLTCIKYEIP